jgi:hypothetical protein
MMHIAFVKPFGEISRDIGRAIIRQQPSDEDIGKALIWVEDAGAFNRPWSAVLRWRRRESNPILKLVCAENSRGDFGYDVRPIPQATRPDF